LMRLFPLLYRLGVPPRVLARLYGDPREQLDKVPLAPRDLGGRAGKRGSAFRAYRC